MVILLPCLLSELPSLVVNGVVLIVDGLRLPDVPSPCGLLRLSVVVEAEVPAQSVVSPAASLLCGLPLLCRLLQLPVELWREEERVAKTCDPSMDCYEFADNRKSPWRSRGGSGLCRTRCGGQCRPADAIAGA